MSVSAFNSIPVSIVMDLLGDDSAAHALYNLAIEKECCVFLNHRQRVILSASYVRDGDLENFLKVYQTKNSGRLRNLELQDSDLLVLLEAAVRSFEPEVVEYFLDRMTVGPSEEVDQAVKNAAVVACGLTQLSMFSQLCEHRPLVARSILEASLLNACRETGANIEGIDISREINDLFRLSGFVWERLGFALAHKDSYTILQFWIAMSSCCTQNQMRRLMCISLFRIIFQPNFSKTLILMQNLADSLGFPEDSLIVDVVRNAEQMGGMALVLAISRNIPRAEKVIWNYDACKRHGDESDQE